MPDSVSSPDTSKLISSLIDMVTEAAGTSVSVATRAKLTAVSAVLDTIADDIAPIVEAKYPQAAQALPLIAAIEQQSASLEQSILALITVFKPVASQPTTENVTNA